MTTTTFSSTRHLPQEANRFDRLPNGGPKGSADTSFSVMVANSPSGGASQEWNVPTPVPTSMPPDLHNRLWNDAPTPPPSTDFSDDQPRLSSPTPVPVDPEDDSLRSDTPTPVPTVTPQEDAAALTHRLAYSLLTGAEFQFTSIVRSSDES